MSRTLEAPNVQMSLEMDEEVVMRMGDDGRRFELVAHERACPGTSLGLTEIAEQVFPVQGRLAINSIARNPDRGEGSSRGGRGGRCLLSPRPRSGC